VDGRTDGYGETVMLYSIFGKLFSDCQSCVPTVGGTKIIRILKLILTTNFTDFETLLLTQNYLHNIFHLGSPEERIVVYFVIHPPHTANGILDVGWEQLVCTELQSSRKKFAFFLCHTNSEMLETRNYQVTYL
jgi:hypothetical protein